MWPAAICVVGSGLQLSKQREQITAADRPHRFWPRNQSTHSTAQRSNGALIALCTLAFCPKRNPSTTNPDRQRNANYSVSNGKTVQHRINQAALIIWAGARSSGSTVRIRSGAAATLSCAPPGAPLKDAAGPPPHCPPDAAARL